jgi:hypothetical protein
MRAKVCNTLVCANCINYVPNFRIRVHLGRCAMNDQITHDTSPFCKDFRMDTVLHSTPVKADSMGFRDTGQEYCSI